MPASDIFTLMTKSAEEVAREWIPSRRWFANGYRLEPKYHDNGKIGLASPNQIVVLDLDSGDFEIVTPNIEEVFIYA